MKLMMETQEEATVELYCSILTKLNHTIATYKHLIDIPRCGEPFEPLEQAFYSRDAQINHLLSITMALLKPVPTSPALEEIFTNFLQDYLHLVNPAMPPYVSELYLDTNFLISPNQPGSAIQYNHKLVYTKS